MSKQRPSRFKNNEPRLLNRAALMELKPRDFIVLIKTFQACDVHLYNSQIRTHI